MPLLLVAYSLLLLDKTSGCRFRKMAANLAAMLLCQREAAEQKTPQ